MFAREIVWSILRRHEFYPERRVVNVVVVINDAVVAVTHFVQPDDSEIDE